MNTASLGRPTVRTPVIRVRCNSSLLGLRQDLDIARQAEQVVLEVLVDFDRIGVHFVDLLTVAVAPNVERPLHTAHIPVFGKKGDFLIEVLVLRIAALEDLPDRQLGTGANEIFTRNALRLE
jgi:hypothetical protein